MKKQISPVYIVAIALVIVAAVAYMLLVRPKSAEQGKLDDEIAALQTQLAAARHQPDPVRIKVADLFKLSKAIPDRVDMAGIILELNSTASAAGISFDSIEPQAAVTSTAYWSVPINVVFSGSYYDLVDFLFRLRNLVSVNDGVLDASGRLFTLDNMTLATDPTIFPNITAKLTISAYVFGTPGAAPTPPPPAETNTTGTESSADTSQAAGAS